MSRVITQRVELDLTLDQIIAIIRQLGPQEQSIVWRALEPPVWSQRLEALLNRIGARVERLPIAEQDVDALVEQARTELYAK